MPRGIRANLMKVDEPACDLVELPDPEGAARFVFLNTEEPTALA